MTRRTLQLFGNTWTFAVPLALLFAIPNAAITWNSEPPWWFELAYTLLIGSFVETLVVGFAAHLAFSGTRSVSAALKWAETRYFAVLGVNVLLAVIVNLGMLTCVLGIIFSTWFLAAVPIAAFEHVNPIEAIKLSFRRSRGHRIAFGLIVVLVALPSFGFLAVKGGLRGFELGAHRTLDPLIFKILRGTQLFLMAVVHVVAQLSQIVAWRLSLPGAATAPAPASVNPKSGSNTQP